MVHPLPPARSNNSVGAAGAVFAFLTIGGIIAWALNSPLSGMHSAGTLQMPVPDDTPTLAAMQQAKAHFDQDRAALKKGRPKTEAEVVRVLGRSADQCTMAGGNNYCLWFYVTKPPVEGRDVLSIAFDSKGLVVVMDN